MEEKQTTLTEAVIRELQAQRRMKQLSQQQVAEKMGTTKSAISRLEKGEQRVSVDMVSRYGQAIGLKPKFSFEMMEENRPFTAETNYCLKLFDDDLIRFSMKEDPNLQVRILWVNEEKIPLLPVGMDLSETGLAQWLKHRTIPPNRAYAEQILSAYGLTVNDTKAILDICKGLSLNDSYWIVPAGSQQTFDDCNLYEHDFMETLSVIAFTGAARYAPEKHGASPEFTTNGMLRKAWRNKGDKGIWLYKGGTEDFASAGNEPFSEALAWQIARRMELNAVPYELENWKGILTSKCRLFTNRHISFVPAGHAVREGGMKACLAYYRDLGLDYYDHLCSMLVFDALIYNEDRHSGNFGLLRDNRNGSFIGPAPIFDNGTSLFCYGTIGDFRDLPAYAASRAPSCGGSFDDVARLAMGPLQKEQLRRLISFRFEDTDPVCLPRWRIRGIEEQLRRRVYELLHL